MERKGKKKDGKATFPSCTRTSLAMALFAWEEDRERKTICVCMNGDGRKRIPSFKVSFVENEVWLAMPYERWRVFD